MDVVVYVVKEAFVEANLEAVVLTLVIEDKLNAKSVTNQVMKLVIIIIVTQLILMQLMVFHHLMVAMDLVAMDLMCGKIQALVLQWHLSEVLQGLPLLNITINLVLQDLKHLSQVLMLTPMPFTIKCGTLILELHIMSHQMLPI